MLKVLHRIVQEVNTADSLGGALQLAAMRTKDVMHADACSIFLVDDASNEYVLVATEGLNRELLFDVRLKLGVGLVGLVGERGEPINLDHAQQHPKFQGVVGVGEERFNAFLGVPITYHRALLGVIIVQREEALLFDESEEAFLATLAAQLASSIAHAKATGAMTRLREPAKQEDLTGVTLTGVPSAPGVSIGQAVVVYPLADLDAVPEKPGKDVALEIALFQEALEQSREDIQRLIKNFAGKLPEEERALFDVYLKMLESSSLVDKVEAAIHEGQWAQGALKRVIKQQVLQFEAMEDSYMQERAADVRDLGQRILSHLQSQARIIAQFPERTVLVGEEIPPSILAEVPDGQLAGVVSKRGASNSHVAILARALGVPTVMGVSGMPVAQLDGKELVVDGYYGQVYVEPTDNVREEFINLIREEHELEAELQALRDQPAQTLDGHALSLFVNTGLAIDMGRALKVGAEGVGLYRTEVPFMMRDRFPSEEAQRVIYRQLLNAFSPRPVLMRTLDVGGDKKLPYFPFEEENPFLGWRGIRITLDHPEIFLVQARAMMRASHELNNLHIMLPMVSTVSEVDEAIRLLKQAYGELREEELDIKMPAVGVMVEVPSAVYQARELAQRVDFLSVGSNDLTQYLLAVDRNNARVASLYDSLHPAVLRALMSVVDAGHKEGKHISICGEMAGDPAAVVLLLAMGFDTLSMSASRVPRMKWVVRKFTLRRAKQLLNEVLAMDDPVEIRCHMELALEDAGLGGLIRAGR